jgi:hypothetical protein
VFLRVTRCKAAADTAVRARSRLLALSAVALITLAVPPSGHARPAQEPIAIDADAVASGGGSVDAPGRAQASFVGTAVEEIVGGESYSAPYWFAYGPTTAYGSRTEPRTGLVSEDNDLTALSPLLDYEQTYHYRLEIQSPRGLLVGNDASVRIPHAPLRPPARVRFEWSPAGPRRLSVKVVVLDARGGTVTVARCEDVTDFFCDDVGARSRRATSDELVAARDLKLKFGRQLLITTFARDRHASLVTRFIARRTPVVRNTCDGDVLVPGEGRCVAVQTVESRGKIKRAVIVNVIKGTRVETRCHGRGCQGGVQARTVTGGSFSRPYTTLPLSPLRRLRPGATMKIWLTRPGSIGIYQRLKVTRQGVQRGPYRCIAAGSRRRLTAC